MCLKQLLFVDYRAGELNIHLYAVWMVDREVYVGTTAVNKCSKYSCHGCMC